MHTDTLRDMDQKGWTWPQPLLDKREALELARIGQTYRKALSTPDASWGPAAGPDFEARPWFKSLHAIAPEFFDLAKHPKIVECVRVVLGHDLLVWGTALITRGPGEAHRWHVDLEHTMWTGVSVFVALDGVRPLQSSLKFIGGSHRILKRPALFGEPDDDAILAQARRAIGSCTLDYPHMSDGEFVMFSGTIWHGSNNVAGHVRHAVLLQYTVPSSCVTVPLNWDSPIRWSDHKPPCALVSGDDAFRINHLVSRPGANFTKAFRCSATGYVRKTFGLVSTGLQYVARRLSISRWLSR